jgi:proliferating cell nuclear antigen
MFKATLENIELFRSALSCISELVSEGVFKAEKDGIYLTVADPTMVTLIDFKYLSTEFKIYDLKDPVEIPVNIDNFLSFLKRARSGDVVDFELDNESNKLNITLKGNSTRNFTLPLIEIDNSTTPSMNLNFGANIDIKTSVIEDGIGDADIITDTINFEANKDEFKISSKGDISSTELILSKGSDDLINIEVEEPSKSRFSLDYLKKIIKASKISNVATVRISNDYPLQILFKKTDKVQISYVLAPRVED